jgi:pimeloyl-ACP methyl ester carboxylesterase
MLLTERQLDTGAVIISYVEGPAGGPPLVLLHGVTSRWQTFLTALPPLMLRWHVVAADLRGHGRSGRVPDKYGLMDYVPDIVALIRHLDKGPAVLIGHSLGAMISIGLASEAPDLVRAVVLEDPPLGAFSGAPFGMRPEHVRFTAIRELARAGHSLEALIHVMAAEGPGQDPLALRARASSLHHMDPEVLSPILESRAIRDYNLGERLARMTCPVLLLQGNPAFGGALSDAEARWAAATIPQCTHIAIPDIGHAIHGVSGQHANLFDRLVSEFLESLPPHAT